MIDDEVISKDEFVETLISAWQWKLGLEDWDIRFDGKQPADDGDQANVEYRIGEKVAVITFDPDLPWESYEPNVVHELLHLVLKTYTFPTERLVAQQQEPLRGWLADEVTDAEEIVVEQLARALGQPRFVPYGDLLGPWQRFNDKQVSQYLHVPVSPLRGS